MKLGTLEITKIYRGETEITKAYLGTNVVFNKNVPQGFSVSLTCTDDGGTYPSYKIDSGDFNSISEGETKSLTVSSSITIKTNTDVNDGGYYTLNGVRTNFSKIEIRNGITISISQNSTLSFYIEID